MSNSNKSTTNPFDTIPTIGSQSNTRRLDFTPALQNKAHERAVEFIKSVSNDRKDLADAVNKMLDTGEPAQLIDLYKTVFTEQTIADDAKILAECPTEDLKKMFESQRSNRSRAKKAGLRRKLDNTLNYMTAMYAELMLRVAMDKPYSAQAQSEDINFDTIAADPDLLKSKINSLASKHSRLVKIAEFDPASKAELEQVDATLARLRGLRPATSRTVVKDANATALREALKNIDPALLPADVLELISKLG